LIPPGLPFGFVFIGCSTTIRGVSLLTSSGALAAKDSYTAERANYVAALQPEMLITRSISFAPNGLRGCCAPGGEVSKKLENNHTIASDSEQ
jgi:hypothetical protein